jgi:hypothetical protein
VLPDQWLSKDIVDTPRFKVHHFFLFHLITHKMLNTYMIHLLNAVGLIFGGSSTVHIHIQTIHRTTQLTTLVGRLSGFRTQSSQNKINDEPRKNYRVTGKSGGRAPSLRVIPWHLPYR